MTITIPHHAILPLEASDIPAFAAQLQASKLPLTINHLLCKDWPNEAAQKAQCTKAVEGALNNPDVERFKVVENSSGNMVAHLVITHKKPESDTKELANEVNNVPAVPEGMVPEIFHLVMDTSAELQSAMKQTEHLSLTHIYVTPASRNKGIGSALIRLLLDRGKARALPISVITEPQAHQFFVKRAFRDTGHVDMNLGQYAPAYCGYGVFRLSSMTFEH